jgi:hypothetical protein
LIGGAVSMRCANPFAPVGHDTTLGPERDPVERGVMLLPVIHFLDVAQIRPSVGNELIVDFRFTLAEK